MDAGELSQRDGRRRWTQVMDAGDGYRPAVIFYSTIPRRSTQKSARPAPEGMGGDRKALWMRLGPVLIPEAATGSVSGVEDLGILHLIAVGYVIGWLGAPWATARV